ncbi:MAG: hypothetical protein ABIQ95_07390, partial [Bdellovibrionia bacterium]
AGNYDGRRYEMLSTLESLKLEPRWQESIQSKLVAYFDYREQVLYDALPIIQNDSTSDRDQAAKWRDHFSKAAPEASKLIYEALQNAMPSSALNFITSNANFEADFFSKLGNMPAAKLRDRILVYRETFDKESRSLSDKWREVDSLDQSIDSMGRSAQNELRELYQQTSRDVAASSISTEKWIRSLTEIVSTLPVTPSFVGIIIEFMKLLEALETRTESYAARLRDIYSNEERVILVFNNTRKDVSSFLKTMNLSLLQNEMNEMLIGTDQAGRSTVTSGQQADAAKFYGSLSPILKAHYERFEDAFEDFVSEFDHIFFNALGDKTIETLLEPQSWRDWSDNVRGIALESALKQVQEQSARNFGVDLNLASDPAQRELIQKWVAYNMDGLKEKVGKVYGLSISDRIQMVIYSSLPSSLRAKLLERLKESESY